MSADGSSEGEGEGERGWDEDWGDVEGMACTSLFVAKDLPSVAACCEHDAQHYGFDLRKYVALHGLDDYGVIKCINYIRGAVRGGSDPLPALEQGPAAFADDKHFQPVLDDDALLFHDFTADPDLCGPSKPSTTEDQLRERIKQLEEDNEALCEALQDLAVQALPDELRFEATSGASMRVAIQPSDMRGSGVAGEEGPSGKRGQGVSAQEQQQQVDAAYFDSYSYFDIHREMLEDAVRTEAYRDALEGNPGLLQGATVVDVGCGTGILSMFAARAGAKRVVAIDGAQRIAGFAHKNALHNKLHESTGGPITVVAGKVEELAALPIGEKEADVIVSEWMGYALLFESMLDSVLHARDRWLKPGGAMLPDRAIIYVAAGDVRATGLDFWDNVYGFSFPDIRADVHRSTLRQPLVAPVPKGALMSPAAAAKEFDLTVMTNADADFHSQFELHPDRVGQCHSLVMWFDTPFSDRFCTDKAINLSTSCHGPTTHWAQTVFLLETPLDIADKDVLRLRLSFARSKKHRSLDISFEVAQASADGTVKQTVTSAYVMEVSSADVKPT